MANPDSAERWIEIESRIAFFEDTSNALNDALIAQQARIDQLERELAMLKGRLEELSQIPDAPGAADEVPPHY